MPRLASFLALPILLGVALRLWNAFSGQSFWLDEAFSAQLAQSSFTDILLAVPRFDTHPPLYYLQLHFWALAGHADSWLLLNSVLLDLMAMASLYIVGRRIWGPQVALWSAAVYAILPLNLFFASNLRMYAQLFLLLIWLWYLLELRVRAAREGVSGGARLGTIVLGIAATLSHGLGFFVVFFLYLQALIRLARGPGGLRAALLLVLDYLPVALFSAWSLGISLFRKTEGLDSPDAASIGTNLTIALLGMQFPAPAVSGYLAALLIVVPALFARAARGVLVPLVLLPTAVLLALSIGVKPVFMYRTIGLFSPFLALGLGLFFAQAWRERQTLGRTLSVVVGGILVAAALNSTLGFVKQGYRGVALAWVAQSQPDAVIFVNGAGNLWGFSRYLPGVPDYSALAVQPPVRDGMLRLKKKLAGTVFERAGLFGETDHLSVGQREIWPWENLDRIEAGQSYWVLGTANRHGCLRPGDREIRSTTETAKTIVECAPAS